MISYESALNTVLDGRPAPDSIDLPLNEALGHVLAEDLTTPFDFPPFDNSAMDGFALGSLEGPWEVVGQLKPGEPPSFRLQEHEAARVFTGSSLPIGSVSVMPQEDATQRGTKVYGSAARRGLHIRRRGEEVTKGQLILSSGTVVKPPELSAIASLGKSTVRVVRQPSVGVITTGDELVQPGMTRAESQIYDSNRYAVEATLAQYKIQADHRHVGDDVAEIGRNIQSLINQHDLLITTGGVSVGAFDYMLKAIQIEGFEIRFHGVSIKPGKPIAFATRKDNKFWFGLPGNPLSTWVGLLLFVVPFLGHKLTKVTRMLGHDLSRRPGREEFVPCSLCDDSSLELNKLVGSNAAFGLLKADGLAQVPSESCELTKGTLLDVHLLPW